MRILHVITGLQKAAGTSTFCGEVCNQLAALGHDVTIAISNPSQPNLYPLNPRVRLVSIESILHCPPTFSTYFLIHIHGLWSLPLHQVSCWARSRRIPVVWSTHGMTAPWALKHKWWKKCIPWYLYQKRDLKRAKLIHCTSDFEVEWNQKLGFERTFLAPLGTFLPKAKEGLEVQKFRSSDVGNTTVELDLRPRPKILLFVGRIYPVKALDRLIEAFALALSKLPKPTEPSKPSPWRLRLVGPDQAGHMAELMSLCTRLGLSYSTPDGEVKVKGQGQEWNCHHSPTPTLNSNSIRPAVEFIGPKFGSDLDSEYANCTALALVSHTENFGATVVDALAHGKPVITSTKTPWKVVAEQGCGFWVDNDVKTLSAALSKLLNLSTPELLSMGANGRKLVEERFTWGAVAETLFSAYGIVN